MKILKILLISIIIILSFIYLMIFFKDSNPFIGGIVNYGEEKIQDIKTYSVDELQDIILEINKSLPIIKEAGYTVNRIDIDMGIPSRINISFKMEEKISHEKKIEILKKVGNQKILYTILKTLFDTEDLRDSIKIGELKFQTISISIGTITSVKFVFGEEYSL